MSILVLKIERYSLIRVIEIAGISKGVSIRHTLKVYANSNHRTKQSKPCFRETDSLTPPKKQKATHEQKHQSPIQPLPNKSLLLLNTPVQSANTSALLCSSRTPSPSRTLLWQQSSNINIFPSLDRHNTFLLSPIENR